MSNESVTTYLLTVQVYSCRDQIRDVHLEFGCVADLSDDIIRTEYV